MLNNRPLNGGGGGQEEFIDKTGLVVRERGGQRAAGRGGGGCVIAEKCVTEHVIRAMSAGTREPQAKQDKGGSRE